MYIGEISEERDSVTVYIDGLVTKLCNPIPSNPTIFKVDDRLRLVNDKDYEPEILAIGLLHRGKDHLVNMEQHKARYLQQLLDKRPHLSIHTLVERLRDVQHKARLCYSTRSLNLNTNEFMAMLLLDGCFIVELLRKYVYNSSTVGDPVFESETLNQIRYDLMMFENQIPLFVLNLLFDLTKTSDDNQDNTLCHLVLSFVDVMFPWQDVLKAERISEAEAEPDHLLGLVYRCFVPFLIQDQEPYNRRGDRRGRKNSHVHINSASELTEAGIELKLSKINSLTFEGGVLRLPPLQVSGKTESLLRNLVVYEQLRINDNRSKHVADYAFFMHCLIRSTKDIEILRRSGILSNYLGGDDRIYDMFDRLETNFLRSSEFSYSGVFRSLNKHCGRRDKKWMANLRRDYFNSPWSLVSFFAATLLLLIALTQTVFSVLTFMRREYETPPHP